MFSSKNNSSISPDPGNGLVPVKLVQNGKAKRPRRSSLVALSESKLAGGSIGSYANYQSGSQSQTYGKNTFTVQPPRRGRLSFADEKGADLAKVTEVTNNHYAQGHSSKPNLPETAEKCCGCIPPISSSFWSVFMGVTVFVLILIPLLLLAEGEGYYQPPNKNGTMNGTGKFNEEPMDTHRTRRLLLLKDVLDYIKISKHRPKTKDNSGFSDDKLYDTELDKQLEKYFTISRNKYENSNENINTETEIENENEVYSTNIAKDDISLISSIQTDKSEKNSFVYKEVEDQ